MNREIKFRGKYYHGEWMYGFLQKFSKKFNYRLCVCATSVTSWKDALIYQVLEETVGQYTGLRDKYGIEIYEGDIMNDPTSNNIGVVEWNSVLTQFQLSWQNMHTAADIYFMVKNGSSVIGNIHDNPELIQAKEDQP